MWSYYDLLTDFAPPVIVRLKEEVRTGVLHPMDAKMQLAHYVIAGFHGEEAARKAANEFDQVYRKRGVPSEMVAYDFDLKGNPKLSRFVVEAQLAESRSEAERLIRQGAVEWDGEIIRNPAHGVNIDQIGEHVLKVGKKPAVRVRIGNPGRGR